MAVLDHGSGNLRSAVRALTQAGAEVDLTSDVDRAATADALVVPGVGAFATCMDGLARIGAVGLIRDWACQAKPLLGICVGFQVLFDSGTEHGTTTAGCGVLTGQVTGLATRRLPHMGWNTVTGFEERFYFVHSYGVAHDPEAPVSHALGAESVTVHLTSHGTATFVAAVSSGSLLATQFHPEKSAEAGAGLLRGWVSSIHNR